MFHQQTMIGGWGVKIPWLAFLKFEVKKVFLPVKGRFIFNCNSRITLHLYLTKPKENGSSANNKRGRAQDIQAGVS